MASLIYWCTATNINTPTGGQRSSVEDDLQQQAAGERRACAVFEQVRYIGEKAPGGCEACEVCQELPGSE